MKRTKYRNLLTTAQILKEAGIKARKSKYNYYGEPNKIRDVTKFIQNSISKKKKKRNSSKIKSTEGSESH